MVVKNKLFFTEALVPSDVIQNIPLTEVTEMPSSERLALKGT